MKLVVVNGSPRGRKSNSDRMLSWMFPEAVFANGSVEKVYVVDQTQREQQMEVLKTADTIFIVFPLYTDGMPGITKDFLEHMEDVKTSFSGKKVAFLIHSGFPEPLQSRAVEKYATYFSRLMELKYLGTIVMGSSEALSVAPEAYFKKKIPLFKKAGEVLLNHEPLPVPLLAAIAGKETMSSFDLFLMKVLPFADFYWNQQLKKNGAFEKRFDRPYEG